MKILLVDDSDVIRLILKRALCNAGYEIIGEAEDGKEAYEKYKLLNPDLVIMDISMYGTDGLCGLKLIRNYDSNSKVIMCTAIGQTSAILKAYKLGAVGYIVKPFKDNDVIMTVKELENLK